MGTSEFTDEQIEALQALADGYNDQSVSRRDVMKLVGAGGVGALFGGGGVVSAIDQASAGTAQSGQLGAVGDPLDLVTEDVMDQSGNVVASANAGALEGTDLQYESVSTDKATINQQIETDGVITLYVRNSGDDSNSGVDSTDALQTIGEAVARLPRVTTYNYDLADVVIDLGAGETYSPPSRITIAAPWANKVGITGDTSNPAIIEGAAGTRVFHQFRSRTEWRGVTIQPADAGTPHTESIRAESGGEVILRDGCDFSGASNVEVHALYGTKVNLIGSAILSGTPESDVQGVLAHSGSHVAHNAKITGYSQGIYADRGGSSDVITGIIDNCNYGMWSEDGGKQKCTSSSSITNCNTAFFARNGGITRQQSAADLTGTTTTYELDAGGRYIGTSGQQVVGGSETIEGNVSVNNTTPVVSIIPTDGDPGLKIRLNAGYCYFRDDGGNIRMRLDMATGDLAIQGTLNESANL